MILNRIMNAIKDLKDKTNDNGWTSLELTDDVTASTSGDITGIQYKKIDTHVYIRGRIIVTYEGSNITLADTLPEEYRPTGNITVFASLNGGRIARVVVNTSGEIKLEWIYNISDGSAYTTKVSWLYFQLDYFVN